MKRNIINLLIYLTIFLIGLAISVRAQNVQAECRKLLEPSIGLSYCVPPKWNIVKQEHETYQEILGETYNSLTPVMSINIIVDEDALSTVVAERIEGLKQGYSSKPTIASVKLVSQSEFKAGNLDGYKIIFNTSSTRGFDARAIFYFFKGRNVQDNIVLSALIPLPMNGDIEKVLDDAVKTLKINK